MGALNEMTNTNMPHSALTLDDIRAVSPALASYTQKSISEDLWKRPDLSPRDRSLVTVAALIARIQTIGMLQLTTDDEPTNHKTCV